MGIDLTLNFCLSSFDRGDDIKTLLMWEGALKWRFLFFLLEEVTSLLYFILIQSSLKHENNTLNPLWPQYYLRLRSPLRAKRQVSPAIIFVTGNVLEEIFLLTIGKYRSWHICLDDSINKWKFNLIFTDKKPTRNDTAKNRKRKKHAVLLDQNFYLTGQLVNQ